MSEIDDIKRRAGVLNEGNYVHRAAMAALEAIDNSIVDLQDELYGIDDERMRRSLLKELAVASAQFGVIKQTLERYLRN